MDIKNVVKRKNSGLIAPRQSDYVERMSKFAKEAEDSANATSVESKIESGNVSISEQPHQSDNSLVMLELNLIDASPYQPRLRLNEEHIAELAASIQTDDLNSPITVRPLPNGRYELIAGEHRFFAYKLNDESRIPAKIKKCDDIKAARSTVFDNIKRKDLTDYETFRGFKELLAMGAVPSIRQLAKDAGMTHTHVNRIMSFSKLPPDALGMLNANPALIGASIAEALAEYVKSENTLPLITAALKKVHEGTLQQMKAPSWIDQQISPKVEAAKREITYMKGKSYATIEDDGKLFKIKLNKKIDRAAFEQALFDFLASTASNAAE